MSRISRRDLLKSTAGLTLAAFFLGSFASRGARAQDVVYFKCLFIFFQFNGRNPQDWFPTAGANVLQFI